MKIFLVVIHAENVNQVKRNVQIAYANGATGVFLINHRISEKALSEIYLEIKALYPNFWVGLNFLNLDNFSALRLAHSLFAPGLWVDNLGIDERLTNPATHAKDFAEIRSRIVGADKITVFGGVAFKYQQPVKDLVTVAKLAVPYTDVVTTSGSGTGIPADLSKIETIKKAIGSKFLAVASGITPENVKDYMPFVDYFLVATGVSHSHTELNPSKVDKLAKIISSE